MAQPFILIPSLAWPYCVLASEFCDNGQKLWVPCLHFCLGLGHCSWHTWNSSRNGSKQGTHSNKTKNMYIPQSWS